MTVDSSIEVANAEEPRFDLGLRITPYNHRMRQARRALGLSQADLGLLVGEHAAVISEIELLKRTPDTDLAQEIADALQESAAVLFPDWLKDAQLERRFRREVAFTVTERDVLQGPVLQPFLREALRKAMRELSPQEQGILVTRFGLGSEQAKTLNQAAREYGVTSDRIRQIEEKALRKLRHPRIARRLQGLLED